MCKNYFVLTYKNIVILQNRSFITSNVISRVKTVSAEYVELRKKFWELEKFLEINVNYDLLTEKEKEIHKAHNEAVKKGHFSYDDPFTNEKILTRLRHFLKNTCCGKACRHCIYNHENVTDERKKNNSHFNTAFWVYEEKNNDTYDDSMYFDGSNTKRLKQSGGTNGLQKHFVQPPSEIV